MRGQRGFLTVELILLVIVGALFSAGMFTVVKEVLEYQKQRQTTDLTRMIASALSRLRSSDLPANSTQFNDFLNRNFGTNLDPWGRPYRAVMASNISDACNATSTDLAVQLPNGQVVHNVIALVFTPGNKPPNAENTLTLNGLNQNETFFRLSRGTDNPLRISAGDLYAFKTLLEYQSEACGGGGGGGSTDCHITNPPPGTIFVPTGETKVICVDGEHVVNGDLTILKEGGSDSQIPTIIKLIGKNGGTLRVTGSFSISTRGTTLVNISNLRLIAQQNLNIGHSDLLSITIFNSRIEFLSDSGHTFNISAGDIDIQDSHINVPFWNNTVSIGSTIGSNNSRITINSNNMVSFGLHVVFSNGDLIINSNNNVYVGRAISGVGGSADFRHNNSITINARGDIAVGYSYARFNHNNSITISAGGTVVMEGDVQFNNNTGPVVISGGVVSISPPQINNNNQVTIKSTRADGGVYMCSRFPYCYFGTTSFSNNGQLIIGGRGAIEMVIGPSLNNARITIEGENATVTIRTLTSPSGRVTNINNSQLIFKGNNNQVILGTTDLSETIEISNSRLTAVGGSPTLTINSSLTISNAQITNFTNIIVQARNVYITSSLLQSNGNIQISGIWNVVQSSTFRVPTGHGITISSSSWSPIFGSSNCFEKMLRVNNASYNAPATTPWGQVVVTCP